MSGTAKPPILISVTRRNAPTVCARGADEVERMNRTGRRYSKIDHPKACTRNVGMSDEFFCCLLATQYISSLRNIVVTCALCQLGL